MTKVNIKGQDYKFKRDDLNNPGLATADGYCMLYGKEICVRERQYLPGNTEKRKDIPRRTCGATRTDSCIIRRVWSKLW